MIIVAAMTRDRVIGKNNDLPWNIPEEMEHFRSITKGGVALMGRRTFDSIGQKPLPGRPTIVISKSLEERTDVDVCRTVEQGIEKAKSYNLPIYVMGGSYIYNETLPLADRMYLSYIKKDYDGDTFFPEFSEDDWEVEKREDHEEFEFVVYKRK
ncbi:dihydrofolate reductase [Nanoarchaeota archaeon]